MLTSSYLRLWTLVHYHSTLVAKHHLPVIRLEKPLSVSSINGEVLTGSVQFYTVPLSLRIGTLHQENISFYVLPKSTCTILLGLPWLRSRAPFINWSSGEVIRWGKQCLTSCMSVPRSPIARVSSVKPLVPAPPGLPTPCVDFACVQ